MDNIKNFTHIVLAQDFFPKIGGAHLFLYEVYKRWPYPIIFLTQDYSYLPGFRSEQARFDAFNHCSIKILRKLPLIDDINLFSMYHWQKLMETLSIIREISKKRPVVLHCLRAFPEGIEALFSKILYGKTCKIITYAHGEDVLIANSSRQLTFMAKKVYNNSELVIANSLATKGFVQKLSSKANTVVVHPGVDMDKFNVMEGEIAEYRKKLGVSNNEILLVTISRMELRKNHAAVIKAIKGLQEEGLSFAYVIAGEGDEESNLRNLVVSLELEGRVKFLGRISEHEKPLCFAAADIHVMPSIQVGPLIEGFGIVFLEAAAAGVPSIAGQVGGQSEAVVDGKTGVLVNGEDLNALKRALRYLAENEEIRKKMGERGKRWAYKHDWNKVTQRIFREIQKVI